jgi:hypothetical protein
MRKAVICLFICACIAAFRVSARAEGRQLNSNLKDIQIPNTQMQAPVVVPMNKLNSIAEMIASGQPQSNIINEWKLLAKQYPNMDGNAAITGIIQKAIVDWIKSGNGLDSISDMTQMDQLALQDKLQKEQQFIQTISNIMKSMNDTLESIVQNLR